MHGSFLYSQSDEENQRQRRDFAKGALYQQLASVDFGSSYIDAVALHDLLNTTSNQTREIIQANNSFLDKQAGPVLGNAQLPSLRRLELDCANSSGWRSENYGLTNAGAANLFASNGYPNLADLSLRRHQLTSGCFSSLLESPFLQQLYRLNLSNNLLGDSGLQSLLDHGPWERLAELNLRHNKISSGWKRKLIDRFGYKILV